MTLPGIVVDSRMHETPPFSPMYSAQTGFRDLSAKSKFLAAGSFMASGDETTQILPLPPNQPRFFLRVMVNTA